MVGLALTVERAGRAAQGSPRAGQVAHSSPSHEQQGLDDDAEGHLGRATLPVDELDLYFDDAATRSGHPVRHLDLEAVAVESHGGEIEPGDDVGPVGAEPAGRIGQGQSQDSAESSSANAGSG